MNKFREFYLTIKGIILNIKLHILYKINKKNLKPVLFEDAIYLNKNVYKATQIEEEYEENGEIIHTYIIQPFKPLDKINIKFEIKDKT